ncbi:MAG: GntR family transcriptional regulator [Phycisphaerae bacterium]|nr:GntR family transcriptional regulator [Phycisphaerae bacterium]
MSGQPRTRNKGLVRGRGKQRLLYRQLADRLRQDIENGRLKPGAMLPSMDDLARRHRINKATVRQAIAELTARGLVYSVPSRGTFVTEPEAPQRAAARRRPLAIGWALRVSDEGNTGRYHTEIMDAVQAALREMRGHLLIVNTRGVPENAIGKLVADARLDGIVIIGDFQSQTIRHIAGSGLPTVLIDSTCRGAPADTILVDNRGGGYQAAEHLLALGHESIALVTGPQNLQITRERLEGAWKAVDDAGLDRSRVCVVDGDFTADGGRQAVAALWRHKPRPTGVFFFNDEMAFGALQALYEHTELRVPEDLSIVGFDDISWAALTQPPLTTVHVEKESMGREAVERLRKHMNSATHLPTTTVVPTRLVVRKSTAQPRRA